MSTLHDRLVDLAADAPASAPDPLLWERASAFHRRRRVGTAVIASVCVILVGVLTGLVLREAQAPVRPAAPGSSLALPTLVERPSPWLPGTSGHPIGPLAALVPAARETLFGSSGGVVGVSATTGEYRFLDLPGDALQGWAMSQDGLWVAYWTTGETRLSPNTSGGQELPVTGVAIYDTITGEVVRHDIATDHGITTYEGLWWSHPERLVFAFGQYAGGEADPAEVQASSSSPDKLYSWTAGLPAPEETDLPFISIEASNGHGSVLGAQQVLDADTGALRELSHGPTLASMVSALDPTGRRVAFPQGSRNPAPLAVARQAAAGSDRGTVVLDEPVLQAVAWLDEQHVAYLLPAKGVQPKGFLESVDIRTGEQQRLLTYQGYSIDPGHLATDLLTTPPVEREAPADPISPRLLFGWSVAVLLIGGYAVWLWRRRVAL